MPLTPHGSRMKARLIAEYGEKKGEQVLYASRNAGKAGFQNIDARGPAGKSDALKRRMSRR